MTSSKKQKKLELKREKKANKLAAKHENAHATEGAATPTDSSPAVRYAELVRGCLYVLTGASLIVAIALGQRGIILSLDDIIENLFAAWSGKIVLALIGLALFLYGFKHLRLIR